MIPRHKINPHLKPLEYAMGARFGWQTGASWRDKLLEAVAKKSEKLGMDELAYCRMAVTSAAELEVLAEIVSNSETRFFREPEQFTDLRDRIIPELIERKSADRQLDIWSAACSTGEEAYSLAILLSESLEDVERWKINILATDLRGPAIISASRGRYQSSSVGRMDSHLRARYFTSVAASAGEGSYDVAPSLKKMIAFRRANLYDSHFWKGLAQHFDLLVCNNLLLYFHALAVKQTVERIRRALRPGGLLMVMKNETGYIDHPSLKLDSSLAGAFFRRV
jgi:chemotaxis protein methyltransferase CheR